MKNLLIIGPFPPLFSYGGPTKSIKSLYNIFSRSDLNFSILSPNSHLDGTKLYFENNLNNVIYKNQQSFFIINNFYKYDTIWLNSFFDKKLLLLILIRIFYKFNLIVSTRGQLSNKAIGTSSPFLKKLFIYLIKFFKHYIIFHSTSNSETDNIKSLFKKIKHKQISNVFDLKYIPNNITEKKFIFYSRIHKKKGLDILLKTINKYDLKIKLDIYGFIEDKDYWDTCKSYIDEQSNVNYMGKLEDGDISRLKNKYSFFILPTLNENFGHVIIELLSIGCIPIISKNSNPFDEEISSIFNLNFEITDNANLKDVINIANNLKIEDLNKLKSKVRPYFEKLNRAQESVKKEYVSFASN
jgi:glycosyltransferase involved in cell wall biosynthesis